jgi:signal transduction histidine kinase
LIADVLPQLSEQDPAKAKDGLVTLRKLTKGALAEMRSLLLELRPSDLQSTRLDIAIGHLATATTLQAPMKVETSLDAIPPLPPKVQVALYRIVQEALNNIVKHARAHNVELVVRVTPDSKGKNKGGAGNKWRGKVSVEISDDGGGFDPKQTEEGHLGLSIMRERAKSIRATLLISSAPGHGSKVTAIWEGATALKERSTL